MLNKDEYNQEEYNDYYRQEVEGAEIGDSDEEGGLMSKLIILLVLLALAIAGYFGYKAMNNNASTDDIDTSLQVSAESSLPQSVQEEPKPVPVIETKAEPVITKEVVAKAEVAKIAEPKPTPSVQSTINSEVTKAVATQGKMSAEEVAAVVAAVMQQMNQQKSSNPSSTSTTEKQDVVLMNELSDSKVDSVSADLIKELEGVDISENTKIDNSKKQVDVYNKVNVQNVSGADTLSQLSSQINAVMSEQVTKDKAANYTDSLKSEVNVRKNEMRIIVVRKGDTLGKIAKRAYGNVMDYQQIYRANPELTRPDRIYIGQKLRIPN